MSSIPIEDGVVGVVSLTNRTPGTKSKMTLFHTEPLLTWTQAMAFA